MSREVIWTNYGLDGVGSYLILRWLRGSDVEVHCTSTKKFRSDFIKWQLTTGTNQYSKIYIVNLDLSKCIDVADLPNCVIIDTHTTHVERKSLYVSAKIALVETTSTTRLLFRLFRSELLKRITPTQIRLIAAINDAVSSTFSDSKSRLLNALYWETSGNKLERFTQDFDLGLRKFTPHQINAINIYFKRLQHTLTQLDVFQGVLPYRGKRHKVCSVFAQSAYDEIAQYLITDQRADIVTIVNTANKTVIFMKSSTCDVPLVRLAEKLCDGGGNANFAIGDLTDKYMEFCKTLRQVC